jgi:hypothetical protein
MGSNPLLSTNLDRLIADLLPKLFQLSRGMDSLFLAGVRILVEDGDDFAALSSYNGAGRNDGDIDHLMVVYPLYVDELPCFVNDAYISPCDPAIGAAVDECTPSAIGSVVCGMINRVVDVGLAVDLTIDGDFGFRGSVFLGQGTRQDPLNIGRREGLALGHVRQELILTWGCRQFLICNGCVVADVVRPQIEVVKIGLEIIMGTDVM